MTPAEEARFIALWQEGLTCPEIAQRLGIPPGTARSRAYALQQQGKISPRPRGGRRIPARQEGTPPPVQRPVQTFDTGAVQTFDTGPVQRLDRREDEVLGLRHLVQSVIDRLDHPPVQTPVQITTSPPLPQEQGYPLESVAPGGNPG